MASQIIAARRPTAAAPRAAGAPRSRAAAPARTAGCRRGGSTARRRRPPAAAAGSSRLRLLDRRQQLVLEVERHQRADMLVDDAALRIDHEGFRHAIDAPFDAGAAVAVGADALVGIAGLGQVVAGIGGAVLV